MILASCGHLWPHKVLWQGFFHSRCRCCYHQRLGGLASLRAVARRDAGAALTSRFAPHHCCLQLCLCLPPATPCSGGLVEGRSPHRPSVVLKTRPLPGHRTLNGGYGDRPSNQARPPPQYCPRKSSGSGAVALNGHFFPAYSYTKLVSNECRNRRFFFVVFANVLFRPKFP
jgi:hypothetical protein